MPRKQTLSSYDSYLFHMNSSAPKEARCYDTPKWETARPITSPNQSRSESPPSEITRWDSLKASQSEITIGQTATEAKATRPGSLGARNVAIPPTTPQLDHSPTGNKRISQLACGVSPPPAPSILWNWPRGLTRNSPSPAKPSTPPADTIQTNDHHHSAAESAHFLRICPTHYRSPIPLTVASGFPDAGRGYYVCVFGCFLGWGDKLGVHAGNPKCFCGLPSRAEKGGLECANEYWDCGYKGVVPARGEEVKREGVKGNGKEIASEEKQEQAAAESDVGDMCWVEGRWVRWK